MQCTPARPKIGICVSPKRAAVGTHVTIEPRSAFPVPVHGKERDENAKHFDATSD
jgi:hypothetical protein